eukprot:scaffold38334_cov24-Attheya_sp.AAC.1
MASTPPMDAAVNHVVAEEMKHVWDLQHTPYPFQIECIHSLIQRHHTECPKVLVVQATGKGKSICMQAAGTILHGVTLVIVPLLALGVDQVAKVTCASQALLKGVI